ncbi:glutathione S-transferase family protein [Cupriavidus sp. 30B13]|uniref:glutathione S-transferase family protein n=1 Tax=Cupriavidus sp. 30B13 TaxID=3384241 RepID=UPI003B90EF56
MRIFDFPDFPNPLRVRIALAEKNLGSLIDFVFVDLPGAEHKQQPFLAINPEGTVPVLELDDGTYLSECTAIIEYLDHVEGKPMLTGTTPRQRAVIHMMQKRAERELLYAVGHYFHYGTPGPGPILMSYKRPEWKARAEWAGFERDRAMEAMCYFNDLLAKQPFVAGQEFSMADITVWAGLYFARVAKLEIPEDLTALMAWHIEMSQRPSVVSPA